MSLIQWPFTRIQYPGLDNPRFVSDIEAANEAVIDGLIAICGLGINDFAIFSGMEYDGTQTPGTYQPGIFYLSGSFWYQQIAFTEGVSLGNSIIPTMNKVFGDTVPRPIYQLRVGQTFPPQPDGTAAPGTSPLFGGNMNSYRMDLKSMTQFIQVLQSIAANLKGAAFLEVGTVPNTVAAGDDSRFGYTKAQANALFALQASVILKGGGGAYVPAAPQDPANKAYVDASGGKRLVGGATTVGDIPTGGITVNISFGLTLPDNNYLPPMLAIRSLGNPVNDSTLHSPSSFNYTTTGFSIRFQEGVGVAQNISVGWIVSAP